MSLFYVCDVCKVSRRYARSFMGIPRLPDGWRNIDDMDTCPKCISVMRDFAKEMGQVKKGKA